MEVEPRPPLADRLRALPPHKRAAVFDAVERKLGPGALADVRYDWGNFWLRASQLVAESVLEDRGTGLIVFTGPRGDGKTQAATYLFDRAVRSGRVMRPRLFAANEADVDKAVVHGDSGIFSLYHPRDPARPRWLTSEGPAGVLRYPNGIEVICFTAAASEGAVAYNADLDLYDDVAKWGSRAFIAWAHARASCRIGMKVGIVATTRRGATLLRKLLKKGELAHVVLRRGDNLRANRFNISSAYYKQIEDELAGTDFLRQELYDEDISATSPFVDLDFDSPPIRVLEAPRADFSEIVVAVDPAEGKGGDHDDWGIGAAGRRHDRHVVALDDVSGSYSDDEAADKALALCDTWDARRIVVETNRGPRVLNALRAAYYKRELIAVKSGASERPMPELELVRAKDGKVLRAGPLRVLYKEGMLHHVVGLRGLEKQQREWEPDGPRRPRVDDRIDWWVHAVHYLADLSDAGGATMQHLAGLADRVRKIANAQAYEREGRDALIRSDKVSASDPRSSHRTRKRHTLTKRRIL